MKKVLIWINILVLTIILVCGSDNIYAESDMFDELRIGLKQYYENVESVHVANKALNMGYIINDEFMSEQVFMSSSGYTFKPTKTYYLLSKETFSTYDQSNELVKILRGQGYKAHVGTAARGVWKVYIQAANSNEANKTFEKVNGKNNLTFEIVPDNGYRTMMELSGENALILENTYQHPQFSSMETSSEAATMDLGKRQYRGRLEFGRYNDIGITAVNIIPLNYYLYSVLPSEMITYWPLEALKAQAVAARNFAMYYATVITKYPDKPYSLCDTTNSQVYKGVAVEDPNASRAVNETANKLIYYGDKIIPTYFFSTSGGHTENSENVWSGTVPYLKGVPDTYELEPEKQPWIKELTANEIKERLDNYDVNIGNIIDVVPLGYTEAGRVINLKIVGSSGEHIIKKETIRTWLGLKSRKFTLVKHNDTPRKKYNVIAADSRVKEQDMNNLYVATGTSNAKKLDVNSEQLIILSNYNIDGVPVIAGKNNTYIFVGQGWGHGVGMSQSGAKGMALEGFSYDEILKYYYRDIDIR